MKTKHLLAGSIIGIFCLTFIIIATDRKNDGVYTPRDGVKDLAYSSGGMMQWINERRANQVTGEINPADVEKARQQAELLMSNKGISAFNLSWTELGPDNQGGRTRALIIDKNNTDIMYAGGVAGGLWKSTTGGLSWAKICDTYDNNAVVSICQAANGDIYFGTGEIFTASGGTDLNSGTIGQGIWKSTNNGSTFTRLASTWSTTDNTIQMTFMFVPDLIAHPTDANRIYAATAKGLLLSTNGGTSWTNVLPTSSTEYGQAATDIKIASDGFVIACIGNKCYISSTGDVNSFVKKSSAVPGNINPVVGRLEFAIAPSNENYIYCLSALADGTLDNVYRSTDKGATWTEFFDVPPGESFNIFGDNNQGKYDNVIAVYPNNENKIILGGVDLWKWEDGNSLEKISMWIEEAYPFFVHADQHAIVFHPSYDGVNNKTIFFANDGGVFRSLDGGITFQMIDKLYITTQFYTVAYSGNGRVIGGTQDNGTKYIDYMGNTAKTAVEVLGGDGGGCAFSMLNPDAIFASIYYGQVCRSNERGDNMDLFYNSYLTNTQNIGEDTEPFVTSIALWESFYDPLSIDSVEFKALTPYAVGDVITARSAIYERPLYYTLTAQDIAPYDTLYKDSIIKIHDTYQAVMAVGLNGNVWITRYPFYFAEDPEWWPILDTGYIANYGKIIALTWSKDGNYLYAAEQSQGGSCRLFRLSNILNARTRIQMNAYGLGSDTSLVIQTQLLGTFSQTITDIAVDPSNPNNVVLTLGNFGNTDYVYFSSNAATTTATAASANFISIQGNLPEMPVYSAVINWDDSRKVIVATEFGVYATEDLTQPTVTWTSESNGLGNVPVFMIRQQFIPNFWASANSGVTNHGILYIGTHGRGMFRCETLRGPLAVEEMPGASNVEIIGNLNVYPNPACSYANVQYKLARKSDVSIQIYDMKGSLVKKDLLANQGSGEHTYTLSTESLRQGTYIICLSSEGKKSSAKFIVH
ncbi:MAG: T9SS type A sorting domain-containing protein [Bacteroidota bacterium]